MALYNDKHALYNNYAKKMFQQAIDNCGIIDIILYAVAGRDFDLGA